MKTICPLCNNNTQLKHTFKPFNYFFCKSCNTLFIHPTPSQLLLNKYYKNSFKYSAGVANENIIRKRTKIILNTLM
ncbi:MAG: hypothetical protein Q7R95_07405, partial [bacterium]|nr:hypothetical protein [bacterium]